jgi:hypothetical protein
MQSICGEIGEAIQIIGKHMNFLKKLNGGSLSSKSGTQWRLHKKDQHRLVESFQG